MKPLKIMLALCSMLLLGACSQASRTNKQAAAYAERLEKGESVSAADYEEIVEFYCTSLDHMLDQLEPEAKQVADAMEQADDEKVKKASDRLAKKSAKVQSDYPGVRNLGGQLVNHLGEIPDDTRLRLLQHLEGISRRYTDYAGGK